MEAERLLERAKTTLPGIDPDRQDIIAVYTKEIAWIENFLMNEKACALCCQAITSGDICALCQHRETYSLADAEDVLELYAVMEQYGREMREELPRAVARDASKALREYALLLKALAK